MTKGLTQQRKRRSLMATIFALSLVLLGVGSAAPAHASHGTVPYLFTSSWNVCNAGTTAGVSATTWAIGQINNTNVSATQVSCTSTWNVSVQSQAYASNNFGEAFCHGTVSNRSCSPSYGVRLNTNTISTTQQWQKTSLHELGHVAGLGHRSNNNSAMTQGASPPVSRTFDAHDREVINATY